MTREQARQGLQAWAGFPVDRQPRPLVLLSPAANPGGFPDGHTKMAFFRGAVEAAPGFPGPLLHALRGEPGDYAGPPLLVTTAALGSARFATDRGWRQLPAWEVRAENVPLPIWVLDPATGHLAWQPPGHEWVGWRGGSATLDADGSTLTVSFTGSPHFDYLSSEVLESDSSVAILPTPTQLDPTSRWLTAVGKRCEIIVVLSQSLGHRVLLDEHGSPVMVDAGSS
jgi:hypothetical protein